MGETSRVLYAGGDPLASERLERTGISTVAVTDRRDVLDRLDDVDCLVLSDTIDGDPLELLEEVRDRTATLPVVLYSREGNDRLANAASAAEPTGYVSRRAETAGELPDRVQEAIEAAEQRASLERDREILGALQDNLTISTYVKDAEGRYRWMADLEEGYDPEEAVGKTDLEVIEDDDLARQAYEDDMQVIETGEPIVGKEEHVEAEEWELWMETTKVPWQEDGEVRGIVGTTIFVNERKELEDELEAQIDRLEQFASYVSHDLRNPLNVARGYLELARESGDPEALTEVETALDRVEEIVNDVVALAREEDVSTSESRSQFVDVVEDAWKPVETTGATLDTKIPEGTIVVAGRSHLQQLLENLFRNAAEHAGPNPRVEVGLLEEGFYVADDGPGIPPEEREEVVEYGHTTGSGAGAGLAIVSEIADLHEWSFDIVESDAGGTRFEFGHCLIVARPDRVVESGTEVRLSASTDVGDPLPGEAREENGGWTIEAGGVDVWGEYDEHHFAYATVEGDVRIEARLARLDDVDEYSKAGVMVRDDTDAGARLAHTGITAEHGSEVLWRPEANERIRSKFPDDGATPPRWYRVDRVGDLVTCSVSSDGEQWSPIDQRTVDFVDPVHVGLAVCSHDPSVTCSARFDDVSVIVADN